MGLGALPGLVAWLWVGRGARKEEEVSMNLVGNLTPKALESSVFLPHSLLLSLILGVFSGLHTFSTSKRNGWNQLSLRSLPVLTFFLTLSQTF